MGIRMEKRWKTEIVPDTGLFDFDLKEVWRYRDLCWMFIRKDYITRYKQTVLGPLYLILGPLLTSGLFSVIFGRIAGISTNGVPDFLFYMLSNLVWSIFSGCVFANNNIFGANAYIMGKVYFPRLIVPIASTLTRLLHLLAQLLIFLLIYVVYAVRGMTLQLDLWLLAVPFLLFSLGIMGMGVGMVVSSLTIKYRDLNVILGFGMNLLMYATPVIYPVSSLEGRWRDIALLNPIAPVIETIRHAFFHTGTVEIQYLLWSLFFTVLLALVGLVLFNRVEKNFIDTV